MCIRDRLLAIQKEELSAIFADMKVEKLFISAKKRENITILEKKLVQAAALPEINQNDIIITNVRPVSYTHLLVKALLQPSPYFLVFRKLCHTSSLKIGHKST